jgi:hypothetical protein
MCTPKVSTGLVLATAVAIAVTFAAPLPAQVLHNGCESDQTLLVETGYEDLDHMGQSIAVGDFNHDGIKDVVMGGYNRPPTGEGDFQQMAAIFLGTGLSQPRFRHRLTIRSVEDMDLLGFSLAFIGDINGDGCDELVVGIPRHDGAGMHDSGRVSIFLGMPG